MDLMFHLKSRTPPTHQSSMFDVGYAFGDTLETAVKDWNSELGYHENKDTSNCWCFFYSSLYWVFDSKSKSIGGVRYFLSVGSLIKLSVDFVDMKVKVYHNNKELNCQKLKGQRIWFGLGSMNTGLIFEMVDYNFYSRDIY